MRDTFELVFIIVLLVLSHYAIELHRGGGRDLAKSFFWWFLFFGGITALMFFPPVVVVVLWALVAAAIVYGVKYVVDWARGWGLGPRLLPELKPAALTDVALEILCKGDEPPPELAERRREVLRLAKSAGSAALLRAALEREGMREEGLGELADGVRAHEDETRELGELVAFERGARLRRGDANFLSEALTIYEPASLGKLLIRRGAGLGSKRARSDTAKRLAREGRRRPGSDALVALGMIDPPPAKAKAPEKPRARALQGRDYARMAFPPAAFLAAGRTGRAWLLGVSMVLLLLSAVLGFLEQRSVAWIFLAVWGLTQVLGMFAVYDLAAERADEGGGS